MPGPHQVIGDEVRAVEIVPERRPVEDLARDIEADAVVEHERLLQRLAKIPVFGGDVQRVRIGEGDRRGLTPLIAVIDQIHRLIEAPRLDGDVEHGLHRGAGRRIV